MSSNRKLTDWVVKNLSNPSIEMQPDLYISKVTKKPCGCGKRKEALNKAFPYKNANNEQTEQEAKKEV